MNQTYLKLYTIKTKLYSHARHIFVRWKMCTTYTWNTFFFPWISSAISLVFFFFFFRILICHRSITFLMDIAAYSAWLFEHVWDVKTFVSLTGFFIFQPGLIVRLIRELRFISSDCVCIKIQELRMIVFLVLCHALKNGSEKDPDKIFKGFPPSCTVFTLFCFVYVSLYFLLTRSSHFKAD